MMIARRGALEHEKQVRTAEKNGMLFSIVAVAVVCAVAWYGVILQVRIARAAAAAVAGTVYQQHGMRAKAGDAYQKSIRLSGIPQKSFFESYTNFLLMLGNQHAAQPSDETRALFDSSFEPLRSRLAKDINRYPHDPILFNRLASIYTARYLVYLDAADKHTAIAAVKQAIELSPARPQYYNLLSDSYLIFNESANAVRAAETSLSLNEQYADTYVYVMRAHIAAQDFDRALAVYLNAPQQAYTDRFNMVAAPFARTLIEHERIADAAALYARWHEKSPDQSRPLINLTITSLMQGDTQGAIAFARAASSVDPSLASEVDFIISQIQSGNSAALVEQMTH